MKLHLKAQATARRHRAQIWSFVIFGLSCIRTSDMDMFSPDYPPSAQFN
jgi:hypothetical protein